MLCESNQEGAANTFVSLLFPMGVYSTSTKIDFTTGRSSRAVESTFGFECAIRVDQYWTFTALVLETCGRHCKMVIMERSAFQQAGILL